MEKVFNTVASLIKEWENEYREYNDAQMAFEKTSKWKRFWEQLKEPKHPNFHSRVLMSDYINDAVIELRCYDGLFLAVRYGNYGYKLDLQGGKKTPLLGSRGMYIDNPDFINLVNDWADRIHYFAFPETVSSQEAFAKNLYL